MKRSELFGAKKSRFWTKYDFWTKLTCRMKEQVHFSGLEKKIMFLDSKPRYKSLKFNCVEFNWIILVSCLASEILGMMASSC